jgi:hypothetical protein
MHQRDRRSLRTQGRTAAYPSPSTNFHLGEVNTREPVGERAFCRDLARDALERRMRKSHGGKGEGEPLFRFSNPLTRLLRLKAQQPTSTRWG